MRFLLAIDNAYTDHRSGAAQSMRTIVEWLGEAGHECRVLCTARFDGIELDPVRHLSELGAEARRLPRSREAGGSACPALRFDWRGVGVTMILTRHHDQRKPNKPEGAQFLKAFDSICERFQPDVMLCYGGSPAVQEAMKRARARGIATVFSLRNHGYEHRRWFEHADHVLTASEFMRRNYQRKIGLRSIGISSPIAWAEVVAPPEGRAFVTFVNPSPHKGLVVFARLARMLGERRPDIPVLLVQSAMDASLLNAWPEVDIGRYPQIVASPSLTEPADIFSVTKILMVPSLFEEPFGKVAAEAMINGVPALVSDRGALPDVVEGGGFVLSLPSWLQPETRRLPSEDDVRPWFDTVCRLWDDGEAYAAAAAAAAAVGRRLYDEAEQRRRYVDYFTTLRAAAPLFGGDGIAAG